MVYQLLPVCSSYPKMSHETDIPLKGCRVVESLYFKGAILSA